MGPGNGIRTKGLSRGGIARGAAERNITESSVWAGIKICFCSGFVFGAPRPRWPLLCLILVLFICKQVENFKKFTSFFMRALFCSSPP